MRLPLGSTDVSASGGTVTLVGRSASDWDPVATNRLDLADAIALLSGQMYEGFHPELELAQAVPSGDEHAPRFVSGQVILWRYGRFIETVRVVRDDERGLVVWIPSGSARLESVPADGRRTREVPLGQRFSVPWVVRESTWTGPGIVRVAPTGKPWSVWFFRNAGGEPAGAYVNLELPHRRAGGDVPAIFSRDLVLDLWVDAEHPGAEDIWLKDADELIAAVEQGRFTAFQAEAIRSLVDHAARQFISDGAWPLDEGWEHWTPDAAMDEPVVLPASVRADAGGR